MAIRNIIQKFESHAVILARHKGRNIRILVSLDDLNRLAEVKGRWHVRWSPTATTFYAQARIAGRMIQMYRYIVGLPSEIEDPRIPNHIDFNGVNNMRSNLQIVTRSINQTRCRPRSTNTSGYLGVTWERRRKVFQAGVGYSENGRRRYKFLGYFDDPTEASKIREKFVAQLGETK